MIPENRVESIQGHLHAIERVMLWNLALKGLGIRIYSRTKWTDVTEIRFGNMGRILGKWRDWHGESLPLSRKNSETRTRGSATPPDVVSGLRHHQPNPVGFDGITVEHRWMLTIPVEQE